MALSAVVVLYIACGAVVRADAVVVARDLPVILPRLLYGALYAEPLHIFVGCNLGIDVVSLYHQRKRHAHDEERNCCDGTQDNY